MKYTGAIKNLPEGLGDQIEGHIKSIVNMVSEWELESVQMWENEDGYAVRMTVEIDGEPKEEDKDEK